MKAPSSGRVVLIRHGRTEWNADRRFQGQLDVPLDDVGRAQAAALDLAALSPTAFLCSSSGRAVETASLVGTSLGLSAVPSDALREIWLGEWQGLTAAEAAAKFPEEHEAWEHGDDVRRGGGETYAEVGERAWPVVAPHVAEDCCVVVVTHGGTARALAGLLTGLPHERWSLLGPLGNCHLTVLGAAGPRGWRLLQHNASALE